MLQKISKAIGMVILGALLVLLSAATSGPLGLCDRLNLGQVVALAAN